MLRVGFDSQPLQWQVSKEEGKNMTIDDLKEGDTVYRTYYDDWHKKTGHFRVIAGVVERKTDKTVKVKWEEKPSYSWPFREELSSFGKFFFGSAIDALNNAKDRFAENIREGEESLHRERSRLAIVEEMISKLI